MLTEFTTWLLQLIGQFFSDLWSFVLDALINVVDLITAAFVALIVAIPAPTFLSNGLNSVYSTLDPGILYLLTATGLPQGLAIIGAGYGFRMLRKFVTLFQW
jgi:hypothetical protein